MRNFCLFLLLVLFSCKLQNAAANSPSEMGALEQYTAPNIRSVLFNQNGVPGSHPFFKLNSGEGLLLQFDDMQVANKNLRYNIIYCNFDWTPSSLLESEYIDGVFQDYITHSWFSRGTYVNYSHYQVRFPNENMRPKLGGNYVLEIFDEGNQDALVLRRRFYVYDPKVFVGGTVERASYARYRDTHHEVDFRVDISQLNVPDPFGNIKVVLKQNWRWDNTITNLKPQFIQNRTLIYDYQEGNLFEAGNEWRFLDLRDINFRSPRVRLYSFRDTAYFAELFPDQDRSTQAYTFYVDQNGGFTIGTKQGSHQVLEADYIMTEFKFRPLYQDQLKALYLYGAFTNWELDERYRLTYNRRDGVWETTVPLKQGYYDYSYAAVYEDGRVDMKAFEGNHFSTENNYLIFVYYRPLNMAADVLVGVAVLNTSIR